MRFDLRGAQACSRRIDDELAISRCVVIRQLSIYWAIDQGSNVRFGINIAQVEAHRPGDNHRTKYSL